MDTEKLIEQLRTEILYADLSTLQAENEKLRAELEKVQQKYDEAREAICTHCMDVPCRGESCYWWRGQKED